MNKHLQTKFDIFINENQNIINNSFENIILFHGSNINFDEFDDAKISTGDSSDLFGKGYYLTNNKDVALFYAKERSKNDKIIKYTNTGIFGTPNPIYSKDADEYAERLAYVNKFQIKGNILNIKTYIIDNDFLNYIKDTFKEHSGYKKS